MNTVCFVSANPERWFDATGAEYQPSEEYKFFTANLVPDRSEPSVQLPDGEIVEIWKYTSDQLFYAFMTQSGYSLQLTH